MADMLPMVYAVDGVLRCRWCIAVYCIVCGQAESPQAAAQLARYNLEHSESSLLMFDCVAKCWSDKVVSFH